MGKIADEFIKDADDTWGLDPSTTTGKDTGGGGGGKTNLNRWHEWNQKKGESELKKDAWLQAQPDKKEESGEKPGYEEYILSKFGKDASKFGRDYLFDKYIQDVLGYEKIELDNGKHRYEKDGENLNKSDVSMEKAGAAAATAGVSSLWSSYVNNGGELSSEDYQKAGLSAGLSGAGSYGKDMIGDNTAGNAAYSGLLAGAGSAGSQYIDEGEVDWGKAGDATVKGGLQSAVGDQAGSTTGNAGAGSLFAGSFGMAYDKATADTWQDKNKATGAGAALGTIGAAAGGTIAGGIGAQVGGMLGGMYGEYHDRPKDKYIYKYDNDTNSAVSYNPQTGKFEANDIKDVSRYSVHYGAGTQLAFTDEEPKDLWMEHQKERDAEKVKILNDRMANFDNLTAAEQLQLQQAMDTGAGTDAKTYIRDINGKIVDEGGIVNSNLGSSYSSRGKEIDPTTGQFDEDGTDRLANKDFATAAALTKQQLEQRKASGQPLTAQQEKWLNEASSWKTTKRDEQGHTVTDEGGNPLLVNIDGNVVTKKPTNLLEEMHQKRLAESNKGLLPASRPSGSQILTTGKTNTEKKAKPASGGTQLTAQTVIGQSDTEKRMKPDVQVTSGLLEDKKETVPAWLQALQGLNITQSDSTT